MPDITMCYGEGCPLSDKCYRHNATPERLQSYFVEPPYKDGKCDSYWEDRTNIKEYVND